MAPCNLPSRRFWHRAAYAGLLSRSAGPPRLISASAGGGVRGTQRYGAASPWRYRISTALLSDNFRSVIEISNKHLPAISFGEERSNALNYKRSRSFVLARSGYSATFELAESGSCSFRLVFTTAGELVVVHAIEATSTYHEAYRARVVTMQSDIGGKAEMRRTRSACLLLQQVKLAKPQVVSSSTVSR